MCPVLDVKDLGQCRMITVEADVISREARPGQFLHIDCGEGLTLRRPISVCAAGHNAEPGHDTVSVVFEPRGEGTGRLARAKPGDTLDILGPLGHGFTLPIGRFVVVGGGIGAAPVLFAAHDAKGSATAVLGFRDAERVMLKDEFEAVCEAVYITTDDGSYGIPGDITGPLGTLLEHGGYEVVLACGPRAMLRAAAAVCEMHSVPLEVSLEERMGCGVGACLVCACAAPGGAMRRVCRDGPVFDAGEVCL